MTILRHLRRIPVTEPAVEGIGEERDKEGRKEEEGECCIVKFRGIEIDMVALSSEEEEEIVAEFNSRKHGRYKARVYTCKLTISNVIKIIAEKLYSR